MATEASRLATAVDEGRAALENPLDILGARELDEKAQRLIRTNLLISTGIGFIPLPGIDVAALLGQQLYMLKSLGNLYGQGFCEDVGKKGVLTLITAMAPQSTLWKFGVGSLLKSIPLVGQTLAVLTSPIIAGATTYALGQVFNLHFASGGTFLSFDPVKQRRHFQKLFEDGLRIARAERAAAGSSRTSPAPAERPAPATRTDVPTIIGSGIVLGPVIQGTASPTVTPPGTGLTTPATAAEVTTPVVIASVAPTPEVAPTPVIVAPVVPEPVVAPVIVAPVASEPVVTPEPVVVAPVASEPVATPEPVIVAPVASKPVVTPEPVVVAPVASEPVATPEPVIVAPVAPEPIVAPVIVAPVSPEPVVAPVTPAPDVSAASATFASALQGQWVLDWGGSLYDTVLSAQGDRVTGTYAWQGGTLDGRVEGTVLRLRWDQLNNRRGGSGELVVAPDGTSLIGTWAYDPAVYKSGLTGSGPWVFRRKLTPATVIPAPEATVAPVVTVPDAPAPVVAPSPETPAPVITAPVTPAPEPSATPSAMVFDGQNSLVLLTSALPAMPAGVTIEFWAFGANDLPRATSVFASWKENGSRVLNIHLPWSDSSIYWDVVSEGVASDRIQKAAEPGDYKGSWTHWAFVKDTAKGEMSIYRGGSLWLNEAGKSGPVVDSPRANIGAFVEGAYKWSGRLAEFRIWDKPRTSAELVADLSRRLTGKEPGLVGYWPLSQIDANGTTPDLTGNRPGTVQGATVAPDDALSAALGGGGAIAPTGAGAGTIKPQPAAGPVLDLKLDAITSDGKVLDASGNNNHGDAKNLTVVNDPVLGNCLQFPGDSGIMVNEPFTNNEAFTISLWLKPAAINDGAYHACIGKQGDATRKPGMWLGPANGVLHYDSYDPAIKRYDSPLEGFFKAPGEWVHVAWVKRGTTYEVYRDGAPFFTGPAPAQFYTANTNYFIGVVDNYWNGLISRVRIYDRSLSAAEVAELVAKDRGTVATPAPAPAPAAPLVFTGNFEGWVGKVEGWGLSAGSGQREYVEHIKFPSRFGAPPQVAVALNYLDVIEVANTRVVVDAREIKEDGFDLVLSTWGDTNLYGAGAAWVALDSAAAQSVADRFAAWTGSPPDWKLAEGGGEREFSHHVAFPKPFEPAPRTFLGLTMLDVDLAANVRVKVEAKDVKPDGFDLPFKTWADTRLHGAGATWVALDVGRVKALTGEFTGAYGVDEGWALIQGAGERSFVQHVAFSARFDAPPQVIVWMTQLDAVRGANLRVRIEVQNLNAEGFDLAFKTWADTSLWSVGVNWLAIV